MSSKFAEYGRIPEIVGNAASCLERQTARVPSEGRNALSVCYGQLFGTCSSPSASQCSGDCGWIHHLILLSAKHDRKQPTQRYVTIPTISILTRQCRGVAIGVFAKYLTETHGVNVLVAGLPVYVISDWSPPSYSR
jgi:hypothetical protein